MIDVENMCLRQGQFHLDGISLHVPQGCHAMLMGETGCGKTTLLEAVAGLRPIDSGRIVLQGRDLTYATPGQRAIGYVPQDGMLFRTMSVRENLAFALTIRKIAQSEIRDRVGCLAKWLGLEHLLERGTVGLSGGEIQRIALGRALANHPPLLLLDEPLNSVDEDTRDRMIELLKDLPRRAGVTILHVSHNRREAERLGDLFFRLKQGKIAIVDVSES